MREGDGRGATQWNEAERRVGVRLIGPMGAFDSYAATARCPACHDIHHLGGQTKVFDPDFGELFARRFTPGRPHPLGFAPSQMLRDRVWDDRWWRVREHAVPGRIAILANFDELFACGCGRPLAMLWHFTLDEDTPSATLDSIELLDALDDDVAAAVDLADAHADGVWAGEWTVYHRDLQALAQAPFPERARQLRAMLAARFERHERWLNSDVDEPSVRTSVIGPMRCEACGDVRTRWVDTMLSHRDFDESVLGRGWTGGVLRPGRRITTPMRWRARDEDRGYYLRLRHPLPADTLTVCDGQTRWGCRCGVGRAWVLLRFVADDEGVELESIHIRTMRSRADLDDIDLVEAPRLSRAPRREPWRGWHPADRAEAIEHLLRSWGIEHPP